MAHMIENNMIAFKGATPWHGLGVAVDANMTGAEMLKIAKMDWKVQRRALAMRDGKGQGLMTDPLSKLRAIVREDTNEVFQVASDRYFPVQNAAVVEFFREFCEAGQATMETVGGLKGGAIVWALARLNGATDTKIQGVDEMRGYLLLATSHDGSIVTIGQATDTRVVCWNTLSAAIADKSAQFRMKHSTKFTDAKREQAQTIMGMAAEQIVSNHETIAKLAKVKIDDAGRVEFVTRLLGGESLLDQVVNDTAKDHAAIGKGLLGGILADAETNGKATAETDLGRLGKAILEAMIDSPGSDFVTAKDTLFGAVNGVTYHIDHVRGRSQDTRLNAAWFGDGDRMKRDAMKVACEMAGINVQPMNAGRYA